MDFGYGKSSDTYGDEYGDGTSEQEPVNFIFKMFNHFKYNLKKKVYYKWL